MKSNKSLIVLNMFALVLLISCSGAGVKQDATVKTCPRQLELDSKLKQMEPVVDSMVPGVNVSLPKERTCTKQKYQRGGYELVVFIKPNGSVAGTLQMPKTFEVAPQDCLKEAVSLLSQFENHTGAQTMQAFQVRFPELYSDTDVGPVKWLVCSREKNPKYFDGWATWVHEVVHDLKDQDCLYNPTHSEAPFCFDKLSGLPERSVARIKKIPTNNPNYLQVFGSIQSVYMDADKEPPIMLFDEVSGYTQTLKAMTLVLKHLGVDGLYAKGDRNLVLLPMFMIYTVNYLRYVQKWSPNDFATVFGKGSQNRKNIEVILSAAEDAYGEWKTVNSCKGCREYDVERNLWIEYLKAKKSVF